MIQKEIVFAFVPVPLSHITRSKPRSTCFWHGKMFVVFVVRGSRIAMYCVALELRAKLTY